MMTLLMPYVAEETAYRREQLMRAWGRRSTVRTPRHGRGAGTGGRGATAPVAPAAARRTALPAR
ncbi:MAG: hypothetical protein DCC50_05450 [Acidobacteria bacterium]|nr:MAG: hypothetical protein DCC50_05450 [Acidobacteriota bacterium]